MRTGVARCRTTDQRLPAGDFIRSFSVGTMRVTTSLNRKPTRDRATGGIHIGLEQQFDLQFKQADRESSREGLYRNDG